jgi:hypothetical protein
MHPDCWSVISDCWNINVVGCPMFVLSQKLKMLKVKLKSWNKVCFGNVNDMVCNAELKLAQIQKQIQDNGHSDVLMFEEKQSSS